MSFTEAVGSGFRKYAVFNGRSSRSEYWWWYLFVIIGAVVFAVVDGIIGTYPLLYLLWVLAVILPQFAVSIRRLHDIDKSGWWILFGLVPLIGGIMLLIWAVSRGTEGPNQFGDDHLFSRSVRSWRELLRLFDLRHRLFLPDLSEPVDSLF